MARVPYLLIFSRLAAGIFMLVLAVKHLLTPWLALTLLVYGLLSDVFDGIIARQLVFPPQACEDWILL